MEVDKASDPNKALNSAGILVRRQQARHKLATFFQDPKDFALFDRFLREKGKQICLQCWTDLEAYKTIQAKQVPINELREKAIGLYKRYFENPDPLSPLDLQERYKKDIRDNLDNPHQNLFEDAQYAVFTAMALEYAQDFEDYKFSQRTPPPAPPKANNDGKSKGKNEDHAKSPPSRTSSWLKGSKGKESRKSTSDQSNAKSSRPSTPDPRGGGILPRSSDTLQGEEVIPPKASSVSSPVEIRSPISAGMSRRASRVNLFEGSSVEDEIMETFNRLSQFTSDFTSEVQRFVRSVGSRGWLSHIHVMDIDAWLTMYFDNDVTVDDAIKLISYKVGSILMGEIRSENYQLSIPAKTGFELKDDADVDVDLPSMGNRPLTDTSFKLKDCSPVPLDILEFSRKTKRSEKEAREIKLVREHLDKLNVLKKSRRNSFTAEPSHKEWSQAVYKLVDRGEKMSDRIKELEEEVRRLNTQVEQLQIEKIARLPAPPLNKKPPPPPKMASNANLRPSLSSEAVHTGQPHSTIVESRPNGERMTLRRSSSTPEKVIPELIELRLQNLNNKSPEPPRYLTSEMKTVHEEFIEAVKNGYEISNFLKHPNFQINYQDENGYTGLHWACRTGNQYLLSQILEQNVDINLPDSAGWTALHYAAHGGFQPIVEILVNERDVQVNKRNHARKKPINLAKTREIATIIKDAQNRIKKEQRTEDRVLKNHLAEVKKLPTITTSMKKRENSLKEYLKAEGVKEGIVQLWTRGKWRQRKLRLTNQCLIVDQLTEEEKIATKKVLIRTDSVNSAEFQNMVKEDRSQAFSKNSFSDPKLNESIILLAEIESISNREFSTDKALSNMGPGASNLNIFALYITGLQPVYIKTASAREMFYWMLQIEGIKILTDQSAIQSVIKSSLLSTLFRMERFRGGRIKCSEGDVWEYTPEGLLQAQGLPIEYNWNGKTLVPTKKFPANLGVGVWDGYRLEWYNSTEPSASVTYSYLWNHTSRQFQSNHQNLPAWRQTLGKLSIQDDSGEEYTYDRGVPPMVVMFVTIIRKARLLFKKYDRLTQLLLKNDARLAFLLCNASPSSGTDLLAQSLVNLFENNDLTQRTLRIFIENEVNTCTTSSTLFRANDISSRLIRFYLKTLGFEYLAHLFGPLIKKISDSNVNCEVDPVRAQEGDNLEQNMINLKSLTREFFEAIISTMHLCPPQIKALCAYIGSTVKRKFPEHYLGAMGGFYFLRYLCPAILQSASFGIIDGTVALSIRAQRSLILIAKILQNLSNRILFGNKEEYLIPANDLIEANTSKLDRMFEQMLENPQELPPAIEISPNSLLVSIGIIHTSLERYLEEIKPDLEESVLSEVESLLKEPPAPPPPPPRQPTARTPSYANNPAKTNSLPSRKFDPAVIQQYSAAHQQAAQMSAISQPANRSRSGSNSSKNSNTRSRGNSTEKSEKIEKIEKMEKTQKLEKNQSYDLTRSRSNTDETNDTVETRSRASSVSVGQTFAFRDTLMNMPDTQAMALAKRVLDEFETGNLLRFVSEILFEEDPRSFLVSLVSLDLEQNREMNVVNQISAMMGLNPGSPDILFQVEDKLSEVSDDIGLVLARQMVEGLESQRKLRKILDQIYHGDSRRFVFAFLLTLAGYLSDDINGLERIYDSMNFLGISASSLPPRSRDVVTIAAATIRELDEKIKKVNRLNEEAAEKNDYNTSLFYMKEAQILDKELQSLLMAMPQRARSPNPMTRDGPQIFRAPSHSNLNKTSAALMRMTLRKKKDQKRSTSKISTVNVPRDHAKSAQCQGCGKSLIGEGIALISGRQYCRRCAYQLG